MRKGVTLSFADIALVNARVLTMNPTQISAEAVAIKDGKIVEVGETKGMKHRIGAKTKVINLEGKTLVPGFIDTHIHVADFGRYLMWLDLSAAKSIHEIHRAVETRVRTTPPGKWIVGRGWDETCLVEKRAPNSSDLDHSSEDNPMVLYHKRGQVCAVNSRALEIAGITRRTTPPKGGQIDTDRLTGEPTGILRDTATDLIWRVVPVPTYKDMLGATLLACERIAAAGVTSVHWLVQSASEVSIATKLKAKKNLPVRICLIVPVTLLDKIHFDESRDDQIYIGGSLILVDGYLASKTAALFQPYKDDASASRGKLLCSKVQMENYLSKIIKAELDIVIHAAGDRAVQRAVEAVENVKRKGQSVRCRMDQAAVLNMDLVERIRNLQVTISVQPNVISSEFSVYSAVERLGENRSRFLYPLRTLVSNEIRVAGGSDCPMEPLNPLLAMQRVVTRENFTQERLSPYQALKMYTVDAAFSSGEENKKGTIETGKLADLVVLSEDLLRVHPDKIKDITVEMTITGGRISHSVLS